MMAPLRWAWRAQSWLAGRLGHTMVWQFGRPALRLTRVAAATGSVFALGYSQGMRDSMDDRDGAINAVMCGIVSRQARRSSILHPDAPAAQRVARIGAECISAAEQHLLAVIEAAADDASRGRAAARLARLSRHRWNFVVIDDSAVNAFVAELLPGSVGQTTPVAPPRRPSRPGTTQ